MSPSNDYRMEIDERPVERFFSKQQVMKQPVILKSSLLTIEQPKPSPLAIPEILMLIFSFLETPMNTASDPNQPLDFVKVDSIKYTLSRPKLHACALVSRLWNQCATKLLWRTVKVGSESGCERLSRTLGLKSRGGQIGRVERHLGQRCWGSEAEQCLYHRGFVLMPSPVNHWIYGYMIQSFTVIPPHGPQSDRFDQWPLDHLISLLAVSCPNLKELNLSNCIQVSDQSMALVANHCLKLEKLNLNRCDLISSLTVRALAKSCKQLRILNLSRPLLSQRSVVLDADIRSLVENNPNLMELRLRNCDLVTNQTVIALAQSSHNNLRALDLSWCNKITDAAIQQGISKHCPNLQSLALNGCKKLTDASLQALLNPRAQLTSLSLAHLPFITDQILTSMAEKLKNLVILSLNGCNELKDASIIALAKHCTQLQSLSLFSLLITDQAVKAVTENCQQLVSLSISNCTRVTDEGAHLISRLTGLQSLYLNGAQITDLSILSIATHCRSIRALSLNDCHELTDKAIVCLSKYCTQLQSLSMNGCSVTAVGIKALADRCADIRELSIKDCQLCHLTGPESEKNVNGNGGMRELSAVGDQVLKKLMKRKIALMR